MPVRNILVVILALCLSSMSAIGRTAAQQPRTDSALSPAMEELLLAVRTKLAVRVIQIDSGLSLAHQLHFTTRIPLAQ